jgi:plastocyanin
MRTKAVVVAAFAALALGACGGGGDDGGSESGGESGGGGGETVSLTAAEFKFAPTSLSAAAGSSIEFTNEDDAEHNFQSEDAGIDEDVDPKGSVTIDLGDVEPGSYEFICEYHPDTMKGTLEVTE